MKSNGVERTINKNFTNFPKPNFLKKRNTFSIIKPKSNSVIKSKYLDLINGIPSYSNNLMNKNKRKTLNKLVKKNLFPKKEKKAIQYEYNMNKKDNKGRMNNSTLLNKSSFYRQSLNNSRSTLSSSIIYKSKLNNIRKLSSK